MNRLSVRLMLAFVAVTLLAVATVALLANWQANGQFQQYVARQAALEQSGLVQALADYYVGQGSWDGVAAVWGATMGPGRGAGAGQGAPRTLLADADGVIRYDSRGTQVGVALSAGERESALAIESGGRVVGYLVAGQAGRNAAMAPAAQEYLPRLSRSLLWAALVAGLVGVAAGAALSRTLTTPLARVAVAARALAQREWRTRAPAGGPTEVAEVAQAFNDMAEALQQAELQRRSLMADIAHELRTPLTVLQGGLRALLDGVYPLELTEIATLYDETRLLSRLVDDLRELALAEAGQLRLALRPVPVGPLVEAAAALFAPAAEAGGVRLTLALEPGAPAALADPDRLAQVLRNLLANALRHTPAGGAIGCRVAPAVAAGRPGVQLVVTDTGAGIAAADLPRVFDRFYRGDQTLARQPSGAGLGLAIAKSLVEAMGGAIGVQSSPGAGATFTVWLAAAPA